MSKTTSKTILVTGASTGFGRLTVETLARQGHRVFATMRARDGRNKAAADEIERLAKADTLAIEVLELDVVDEASVDRCIQTIVDRAGRIDVVVNNAGVMPVGISEGYTMEQVRHTFDVNVFGPARLVRAAAPHMRKHNDGLFVTVTSIAGRLVFPYFSLYCATKFAADTFAEGYRYELSQFGIDSVVVEPGPFPTKLIANSPKPKDTEALAAYGDTAKAPEQMLSGFQEMFASDDAPNSQDVADDIARLVAMPRSERPVRTVSGVDFGARALNDATGAIQSAALDQFGLTHLDPTREGAAAG